MSFVTRRKSMALAPPAEGGQGVSPQDVRAIAGALPRRPEFHLVQGSTHLSFIMPCTPAFAKIARDGACTDPPGFDRAAFHHQFNAAAVAFFRQNLR